MTRQPLLEVEHLSIAYGGTPAVHDLSFAIARQEAYGLVGESGSGKSTVAMTLLRYLAPGGHVRGGRVLFDGQDVLALDGPALRDYRGRRAAMVYQNPGAALNPSMVVGDQVAEVFGAHEQMAQAEARRRALEMLRRVQLQDAEGVYERFPHQLSGGMQQRVVIAMALAARPDLLILDEPTTGLDATVEAAILELIGDLRREFETTLLLISHNLAVVAEVCDRVGVLYAGRLVEEGAVGEVFERPVHPYTRGLLASLPSAGSRRAAGRLQSIPGQAISAAGAGPGCAFAPRCGFARERCRQSEPTLLPADGSARPRFSRCYFWDEVLASDPAGGAGSGTPPPGPAASAPADPLLTARQVHKTFRPSGRRVVALDGVTLEVPAGRTVGLVGESGSGKSTLARVIAGLEPLDGGSLEWRSQSLPASVDRRPRALLRQIQMVFQDPDSTLNPRHRVRTLLERSLRQLTSLGRDARRARAAELLLAVGLDERYLEALPGELSGGQRQRVAIARAFAGAPALVLCDEPTSSLDASVQATVLNLLGDLQGEQGTAYLFISHDLGVVRYLADQVGILYRGRLMQLGTVEALSAPPHHPYTEVLLASVPGSGRLDHRPSRASDVEPVAAEASRGCPYQASCPRKLGAVCETEAPPWRETAAGGGILCHIPLADLTAAQSRAQGDRGSESPG